MLDCYKQNLSCLNINLYLARAAHVKAIKLTKCVKRIVTLILYTSTVEHWFCYAMHIKYVSISMSSRPRIHIRWQNYYTVNCQ